MKHAMALFTQPEFRRRTALTLLLVALSSLLGACNNFTTRQPPIWVWWDMKKQAKYKPQAESEFFADGRTSRRPVDGAIAQETYVVNVAYSTGAEDGKYVARNPEAITKELLLQGQTKFNIYCAPCHDRTGSGRGVVPTKAIWVPGNLHDDRIVNYVDGELYHVITNGRRSMPGYRFQVAEKDRWAIVAYIRALQRSWRGTMADVPAELQSKVR
jgi:mono/diheme cytochrome c family protein